ncbi:putative reverse transcriptase domain-containing protein [Tanacetum coccineum]
MERKEDESLYFIDRIWVPLVGNVRMVIMDEAHKSRYSVHPRADKMYHDLRDMYWWPRMKRDIAIYVSIGYSLKVKNQVKTDKNQAREWKEHEKSSQPVKKSKSKVKKSKSKMKPNLKKS